MAWRVEVSARVALGLQCGHTAIQCCEDPWIDRGEIDALNSLTPRKQLSLYFVNRVSCVPSPLSHYHSLAQLEGLVLVLPLRGGVCHLWDVHFVQHDEY